MGTLTFQDIIAARQIVTRFLKSTPLIHYPELSERLGFQAYIKHENHNPTGSFKVRGGLNFMHHLPQTQRKKGVYYGNAWKSWTVYRLRGGTIWCQGYRRRATRK